MEHYRCPRCGGTTKEAKEKFIESDRGSILPTEHYILTKFRCRNCDMVFYVKEYGKEIP